MKKILLLIIAIANVNTQEPKLLHLSFHRGCIIDVEDISQCVHDNVYFNEAYRPIPITEDVLLSYEGFEKHKSKIIDSFSINISWSEKVYKVLSLTIEPGNQYVYLREQNDELPDDRMADNIVCIFNGDIHGEL